LTSPEGVGSPKQKMIVRTRSASNRTSHKKTQSALRGIKAQKTETPAIAYDSMKVHEGNGARVPTLLRKEVGLCRSWVVQPPVGEIRGGRRGCKVLLLDSTIKGSTFRGRCWRGGNEFGPVKVGPARNVVKKKNEMDLPVSSGGRPRNSNEKERKTSSHPCKPTESGEVRVEFKLYRGRKSAPQKGKGRLRKAERRLRKD